MSSARCSEPGFFHIKNPIGSNFVGADTIDRCETRFGDVEIADSGVDADQHQRLERERAFAEDRPEILGGDVASPLLRSLPADCLLARWREFLAPRRVSDQLAIRAPRQEDADPPNITGHRCGRAAFD